MAIRPTNQRHRICGAAAESLADERHRRPSRSRRRFWITASLGFLMTASTGCSIVGNGVDVAIKDTHRCIDETMVGFRNRALAERAWIRVRHAYLQDQYHRDFKKGFIAGYIDIANGSEGCTPALAPSEYWGWKYQSAAGQSAINAWFQGYPIGAKAAEQDGVGFWRNINVNLKTPAVPQTMGSDYQTPPGVPVPYLEDGESLPVPAPKPFLEGPELEESPSDLPSESEVEIVDPASVFAPPYGESEWIGPFDHAPVDAQFEIATRPVNPPTREPFVLSESSNEFSEDFVDDSFVPVESEYETGSDDLPFSFE